MTEFKPRVKQLIKTALEKEIAVKVEFKFTGFGLWTKLANIFKRKGGTDSNVRQD